MMDEIKRSMEYLQLLAAIIRDPSLVDPRALVALQLLPLRERRDELALDDYGDIIMGLLRR